MIFEPPEYKFPHTKIWYTFAGFNQAGWPTTTKETQTVALGEFDEYFIHRLSDHLPTIDMNPEGDGLDRLRQFKELYIETLLEARHEYVKNSYTPP